MQFEQQPKQRGIDEARPTILATEGRDAAMVAKQEWPVSTGGRPRRPSRRWADDSATTSDDSSFL
jgi:hypothetical protein